MKKEIEKRDKEEKGRKRKYVRSTISNVFNTKPMLLAPFSTMANIAIFWILQVKFKKFLTFPLLKICSYI